MSDQEGVERHGEELRTTYLVRREICGHVEHTDFPVVDLTVRICRLREMERPPSSVSSRFTRDASNASSKSSASLDVLPDALRVVRENGSMFQRRMVAS